MVGTFKVVAVLFFMDDLNLADELKDRSPPIIFQHVSEQFLSWY